MKEIVASSTSRMISAAAMPSRRALTRCSGGSLLVRIEMKIRLSMPSTTSIAISVTSAAQPSAVVRNAKCGARTSRKASGHSVRPGAAHRARRRRTSREALRQERRPDNPFPRQRLRHSKGDTGSSAARSLRARRRAGGNLPTPRRKRFSRRRSPVHAARGSREGIGHGSSGRGRGAASRSPCRWSRRRGGWRSSTSASRSRSRTSSATARSIRSPWPTGASRR